MRGKLLLFYSFAAFGGKCFPVIEMRGRLWVCLILAAFGVKCFLLIGMRGPAFGMFNFGGRRKIAVGC